MGSDLHLSPQCPLVHTFWCTYCVTLEQSWHFEPFSPTNMTSVTSSLIENNTLLRIALNDPISKSLHVIGNQSPAATDSDHHNHTEYYPSQWGEWECAGYCIAQNTNINELTLTNIPDRRHPFVQSGFAFFLMGVDRNTSITRIHFDRINMNWKCIFEETLLESLCKRITHLTITNCILARNAVVPLCNVILANTTKLTSIKLSGAHISTDSITQIVSAINSNTNTRILHLRDLDISGNIDTLGREGVLACRPLLTNPHGTLERLFLDEALFDDEITIAIAESLWGNKCLMELHLIGDATSSHITKRGEDSICNMLCNTSSIMNTCTSNHALTLFGKKELGTSEEISSLLYHNLRGSRHAKCFKVAMVHFKNIQEINNSQINEDIKFGVIPYALAWLAHSNTDSACHTACYNLLRQLAGVIFENKRCPHCNCTHIHSSVIDYKKAR